MGNTDDPGAAAGRTEPALRGRRVLVTGASGLMGFPVAMALAATNRVTAAARFRDTRDAAALRDAGADVLTLDLADPDLSHLPPADVVFHLGAMTDFPRTAAERQSLMEVNTQATGRLALHYAGCEAFVYASSGSTYAFQGERALREDDSHGLHNGLETYAASKIASEQILQFLSRAHRIPVTILRIFSAYGPRGGAIAARVDRVIAGEAILLYPGFENRASPIYETDYVEKVIRAASIASVPPVTVNLAGTEPSSIEEYCSIAGEMVGREPVFDETPDALYPTWADTTRMEELLGKTSVSVREGIRRVVEAADVHRTAKWSGWREPAD